MHPGPGLIHPGIALNDATWLNVSEWALLVFSFLVVLGLIGEHRERWKRYEKTFERIVIIGVLGELLADGGIFRFSHRMQMAFEHTVAGQGIQLNNAEQTLSQSVKN